MLMKRISTLLTAVMLLCGTAFAQNTYTILQDHTSKLTNADFGTDSPVTNLVRTYAKDMTDAGLGAGGAEMYGMQPVTGWTASRPTDNILSDPKSLVGADAAAAATYPYVTYNPEGDEERPGLGGNYYPPYASSEVTGNCLGLTAVWSQDVQYTQPISLPAGAYMIIMKYCNVGNGESFAKNLWGFIVDDTERYMSTATSYAVGLNHDAVSDTYEYVWSSDTIFFQIDEAKSGQMSLGFVIGDIGSGSTVHLFVDNVKVYQIDPNDLIRDEINAKKEELLKLIEIGTAYGVDTSASQTVYDDPHASMDDVLNAIENQKAINDAGTTDFSEYFIQNPHFTMDDPITGGICTYDYDCATNGIPAGNYSMLPVTGWTRSKTDNGAAAGIYEVGQNAFLGGTGFLPPTTMSDGSTEGKLLGMVTCWSQTMQYTQYVSIPAGKYILSVSYYNAGGASAVSKNLIGFIADDGTEYLCKTTAFPVGKWDQETIEFELAEETSGNFSMGYTAVHTGSGNMPHFFIDGISLIYIGTGVNVSLEALKAAVRNAKTIMSENDFYSNLRTDLQNAVNAGQTLIDNNSNDNDANKAATEVIANLIPEVQANIDAYSRLSKFYYEESGALNKANAKYADSSLYSQTFTALSELTENVESALNYYGASTEAIEGMIGVLEPTFTLTDELQADWDAYKASGTTTKEINVSDLFTTLGVTYSTSALQGTSVPDKQWNYGDASNFKTQYGTMEVWNQSPFEVKQTLTEMPAGTYILRTHAFYRTADNTTNISTYDPDDQRAFVFAGYTKTALTNNAAFSSSENPGDWAETAEGSGVYVPNSQSAALAVFTNAAYDANTLSEAKTTLATDGDITFGICADQMESSCWVVWYTFELLYKNTTASDLDAELDRLMDYALDLMDTDCMNVDATYNALGNAYNQGSVSRTDMAKRQAAYTALKDAIALGEQTLEALDELKAEANFYDGLTSKYPYETTSKTLYGLLEEVLDEVTIYDEIDNVLSKKDAFRPAWDAYVLGQKMAGATEDEPVDITGIILNNDFELLSIKYWQKDDDLGTNVGYQDNATYNDADGTKVIEHFMEAWIDANNGVLGNGKMWQTIPTPLPQGYYQLEADAFAVNQNGLPDEGLKGIYLWASDDINKFVTPITVADDNERVAKHFTVDLISDGVTPMVVGISISNTNANWYVVDNFKLKFVGTTPPVGINDMTEAGEAAVKNIYTLTGVRVNTLQRGINIVVDQNGKAHKVIVK